MFPFKYLDTYVSSLPPMLLDMLQNPFTSFIGIHTPTEKFKEEYFFELKIGWCPKCAMVQLLEQPKPEMMFNENYAFFSGTSKYMAVHFEKFAHTMMDRYVKGPNAFVVEIGSNDGIMLRHFKNAGIKTGLLINMPVKI